MEFSTSQGQLLEQYSQQHPNEVLLVTISLDNETDQIMIYRGFSSSLTGSTAYDPDIPIIPTTAQILTIDRLKSPYTPQSPQYLEQGMSWEMMKERLS
ncbi:MAG: hypothetical protein AB4058_19335 [Microcystaceae cyanobacterium]